jgi:uncharacterized membrane protein
MIGVGSRMHPSLWLILPLIALALLAFAIFVFLFYKVMSFSFRKIGIPRHLVIPALVAILIGDFFNIPIWHSGGTTVAVNVGGAIIPLLISFYLLRKAPLLKTALSVAVVATVSGLLADVDAGGITLSFGWLILPFTAVSLALILARRNAPQVAFVAGALGAIIGVDLVHLPEISHAGAVSASIGGRGVFDGILTTGIIASVLAGVLWRKKETDRQAAG